MISSLSSSQVFWFLERALVALIFLYFIFSILIARQVELLISNIKTNLSTVIFILSLFHLVAALLCFVAALGLVF